VHCCSTGMDDSLGASRRRCVACASVAQSKLPLVPFDRGEGPLDYQRLALTCRTPHHNRVFFGAAPSGGVHISMALR
jgi:hypothetical protein